jgi:hypothetical protein
LGEGTLAARGRAVGTIPTPYWLSYDLETGPNYVTQRLQVSVEIDSEYRKLDLVRDNGWVANGTPIPELNDALDCDLGLCPLTNTMPILRHRLNTEPGRHEFLMAWISVPDLEVRASRQIYTHLGVDAEEASVRYESGTFASDLLVDGDGLVIDYPQLATRAEGARAR